MCLWACYREFGLKKKTVRRAWESSKHPLVENSWRRGYMEGQCCRRLLVPVPRRQHGAGAVALG